MLNAQPLYDVLEATGYLTAGGPAPGVSLEQDARDAQRARNFTPDATWRGQSTLKVYFKYEEASPSPKKVAAWRQEVWNEGVAPLLWVICPDKVEVYNGFARPKAHGDADAHRIRTFKQRGSDLRQLDTAAGRLAMETGRFWQDSMSERLNRNTSVDRLLLRDIARLARDLVSSGMDRSDAQSLIGRSIFAQYLVDRRIVTEDFLAATCGRSTLSEILRQGPTSERLFGWLRDTFNGDLFPGNGDMADGLHLSRVADFLEAEDATGQTTLFPYQFNIIPVELISSIYEQFAQPESRAASEAAETDVHYTRLSLVSLVLDEVLDECSGDETVLDLTCGSGVFLVEALRKLVEKRAGDAPPTRDMIRETLYEQVFGMDISGAAVEVAAFSLYLTALELDPHPEPPSDLAFKRLIGRTLFAGDIWQEQSALAHKADDGTFDVIVGNPPWSYSPTPALRAHRERTGVRGSRGTSLDFVHVAAEYASPRTRFGLVLGAHHFFGRHASTRKALRQLMTDLSPVTLVNLANLSSWLFPQAKMPGMVLFGGHRRDQPNVVTAVQVPWSPGGEKSHTFDLAPGDVTTLPVWDWEDDPRFLKGAFLGTHRDLTLVEDLWKRKCHRELTDALGEVGAKFRTGLTRASRSRNARAMRGLPWLDSTAPMAPFSVPAGLVPFNDDRAQRPRDREIHRAPLLIMREFLLKQYAPRPLVAVAARDLVYSDAYFGVAFSQEDRDVPHLLAGVLSSSLAAWFLLMTSSTFGIGKRRIQFSDIGQLPVPALPDAAASELGARIADLARSMSGRAVTAHDWTMLDEAVFDLYKLRPSERIVVRDGLFQATWQWQPGRTESVAPASTEQVMQYAKAFVSAVDVWLRVRDLRHIRAEVFDHPTTDPVRVVRFVLEDGSGPSVAGVVAPARDLKGLLDQISGRLGFPLADKLTGQQEVRAYDTREIVIVKPAARRNWMGVCGLRDADDVVVDSLRNPGDDA